MYRKTKIYSVSIDQVQGMPSAAAARREAKEIHRKYGSQRSHTIYVVAMDPDEAVETIKGFVKQQLNLDIDSEDITASETYLIMNPIIGPKL